MELKDFTSVYFLGIGGIGMSALARFFQLAGCRVSGYDRTSTPLTDELISEGMDIHFEDNPDRIPEDVELVVRTPAIPKDSKELIHFEESFFPILKRAEVLGMISGGYRCVAVAGSHGKTTVTTLTGHLFRTAGMPHIAFLGGISRNYNTNFLYSEDAKNNIRNRDEKLTLRNERITCIVEADEFDRSFHHLAPDIALITSADADHLDIYHHQDEHKRSFEEFTHKILPGGILILKHGVEIHYAPSISRVIRYSGTSEGEYHPDNVKLIDGLFHFDLVTPRGVVPDLILGSPGLFNLENAVAASAAALESGIASGALAEGLRTFSGVRRRFDMQLHRSNFIYIDDYAHHPEELKACIEAVKILYPGKKITGVFQPHLFSRTRDFADQFATVLSSLDEVILLDIYPAREKPIPGITSGLLLDKITSKKKKLVGKEDLIPILEESNPEILLTMGAGDIDQMVEPIKKAFA